jgi:hypothetical protein
VVSVTKTSHFSSFLIFFSCILSFSFILSRPFSSIYLFPPLKLLCIFLFSSILATFLFSPLLLPPFPSLHFLYLLFAPFFFFLSFNSLMLSHLVLSFSPVLVTKRVWKQTTAAQSERLYRKFPREAEESRENFSQCPDRDPNAAIPEYKRRTSHFGHMGSLVSQYRRFGETYHSRPHCTRLHKPET